MSWFERFRNVFRSDAVSDEIDREMAFHLAERADDLEAAGVSRDEARRVARRRFGSYALQKENTRDRDLLVWLDTLLADFRYGLRGLRRNPVFGLTAVLTLAIGIGANTAVFTLLYGLLLRSLPAAVPQQLAHIGLISLSDAYYGSPRSSPIGCCSSCAGSNARLSTSPRGTNPLLSSRIRTARFEGMKRVSSVGTASRCLGCSHASAD